MSLTNLKTALNTLINFRQTRGVAPYTGVEKRATQVKAIEEIDNSTDTLLKTALDEVDSISTRISTLGLLIPTIKENNTAYINNAFRDGISKGINMQKEQLRSTLINAKQLLVEQLIPVGIIEHRVPQFIEWFEKVRDVSNSQRQDLQTYKVCKSIAELTAALADSGAITS
jgi:hypothetical protein